MKPFVLDSISKFSSSEKIKENLLGHLGKHQKGRPTFKGSPSKPPTLVYTIYLQP